MGFHEMFSGFVEILRKAFKIFYRNNGKLIPFIILIFLFLSSILLLSNILSIKPFLTDFVIKLTIILLAPSSSDFANLIVPMKYDLRIFAGIEWIYIIASAAVSLLFATSTILSSSAAHREKDLFLKHLISCVAKTWKRPFLTFFYTTLLDFGYILVVLVFIVPFVLIFDNERTGLSALSTLIFILTVLLYFYLAVVWTLAIVVSVLEEKCGIEALGKAGEIVKGLKLKGFLLKLLFGALYYILLQLLRMINNKQSTGTKICVSLVLVNSVCFVKMFSLIAFTVFYHECKKMHGEEVDFEIQGGVEYTKVENQGMPLISANIV